LPVECPECGRKLRADFTARGAVTYEAVVPPHFATPARFENAWRW
jgi:hypothetical protein